jgi:hypothetical protein
LYLPISLQHTKSKHKRLPRRILHCSTSSGRITLQRYSLASTFCSLTIVLSHDNVVAIRIKQLASSLLAASAKVQKILCIGRQIWGRRRDRNIVVVAKKDRTTVRTADTRASMCAYVDACVKVVEVGDAVLDSVGNCPNPRPASYWDAERWQDLVSL